jgi:hypothetical protein
MIPSAKKSLFFFLLLTISLAPGSAAERSGTAAVFNVRDFGATGNKGESAQAAIQKAVDACASAGGGTVLVPPEEYATGTIHLRSHVRFQIEAGATVYSIKRKEVFDKDALFYGEGLTNITLEGRGLVNGEGRYDYRPKGDFHDDFIYPNQVEMEKRGKPLIRSFPKPANSGNWSFSCAARMSASPASRSSIHPRGPYISTAARGPSSTASSSNPACATASGRTASTRTAARIFVSPIARSRRGTTPSSFIR